MCNSYHYVVHFTLLLCVRMSVCLSVQSESFFRRDQTRSNERSNRVNIKVYKKQTSIYLKHLVIVHNDNSAMIRAVTLHLELFHSHAYKVKYWYSY